ncbi:hypothetical protein GQ600_14612 [Phytophthora cactorum]|nr:hypothetical protein GQ600_14612 [Phytophthora cactorum]
MLTQPPSFPGFENAINGFVAAAGVGLIIQLTLMTSVEESLQWPICEIWSLREASLSVVHFGTRSRLSRRCRQLVQRPSALDLLGSNIQEEVRSAVFVA